VTATTLFDLLSRDTRPPADGTEVPQLANLAEKMIAGCLSDLEHLNGYEQDLGMGSVSDAKVELELRQTIWQLYNQWAASAVEIYDRAKTLRKSGASVKGLDQLDIQIGNIQARLTIKPEQLVAARQQVREGMIVPAKELRNELNARVRR
jgi:hypothetical protein